MESRLQKKKGIKMGIVKKSSGIDFADLSIKKAFEELTETNKELHKHLIRAFNDILENAFCGRAVKKRLIPKGYLKKYDNLWIYNLPDAWRLLYSIKSPNKIEIISVVLDWMNHKDYERLFRFT